MVCMHAILLAENTVPDGDATAVLHMHDDMV